jgi:crossover junction endodeoxyribonuclease RuvC
MLILGLDPGTATTGFGLIKKEGNKITSLDFGLIETDKDISSPQRLILIHKEIKKIISQHKPDVIAMERLFFAANAKTAMDVGRACGIMIFTAAKANLEVFEYAPMTIKKIIAGDGRADKKMVQKALRKVLGAKVRSKKNGKTHFDNAADALAVALCHAIKLNEGRLATP